MAAERSPTTRIPILRFGFAVLLFIVSAITTFSQQPFVTDDADVTARRRFHFELSNQTDSLQPISFPSRKQNTVDFEVDFGLFHGVEVGIEVPIITIFNDRGTQFGRPT